MADRVHTTLIEGDGPTVAFLHGLFGQGKNFHSIAKDLTPAYRSVLVDLPNHGESAWTDSIDYIQMADAIADQLRTVTDQVTVVGHSMGGKVAMVLALRHPDLVERLVVVDISPVNHSEMSEFAHYLDSLATIDLSAVGSRRDADDDLAQRVDSRTVRGFLLQNLVRTPEGWTWRANLELLRRDLPAIGGFPEDLRKQPYFGPVLWIAGANSSYVRDEYAEAMRTYFPAVHKIVVKDAGHWVHSEQRETFTAILRYFLSRPVHQMDRGSAGR